MLIMNEKKVVVAIFIFRRVILNLHTQHIYRAECIINEYSVLLGTYMLVYFEKNLIKRCLTCYVDQCLPNSILGDAGNAGTASGSVFCE